MSLTSSGPSSLILAPTTPSAIQMFESHKDQIAKTEKMRDEIVADLKAGATKAQTEDNSDAPPQSDGEIGDSSPMLQLQGQLRANQIEITNPNDRLLLFKPKLTVTKPTSVRNLWSNSSSLT